MHRYDETTISQAIHTKWAGKTVHFAKETDSTNLWIKRLAKDGAAHGTLAVTEFQSAGRGRLGRSWEAPEGSSVMMTLLLRPDFEPALAPMLTLVMGLSVAAALKKLKLDVSIKWPNDVVADRRKICGILTEMGVENGSISHVAIGVGINVNLEEFPEEMQDKAISMSIAGGRTYDRTQLIALVMECFEEHYETFMKTRSLAGLQEEYHSLLANLGQPVRVLAGENSFEGIAEGINEKGELIVRKESGDRVSVSAGEVSVRGLYSYV